MAARGLKTKIKNLSKFYNKEFGIPVQYLMADIQEQLPDVNLDLDLFDKFYLETRMFFRTDVFYIDNPVEAFWTYYVDNWYKMLWKIL